MPFLILSEDFMFSFSAFSLRALIAQSVEHGANNARVVGSSPTGSIFYQFCVDFLHDVSPFFFYSTRGLSSVVEQLTPDQPVSGSIPLVLTFLLFLLCLHHNTDFLSFSL